MVYLYLALEFFKTGLFAVGGGMATLPFLFEMAERYPWFDAKMLTDMIAISQSTPGPIGINMSTFAGYAAGGVLGAFIATVSLVLPSLIIICIIAHMLERFSQNQYVQGAFLGLRPAVTGLILAASMPILKLCLLNEGTIDFEENMISQINYLSVIMLIVMYIAVVKLKKHPIMYIIAGAALGILLRM